MPPVFSIVTPALNGRAFLPRNLASVRSQGLPPGQIEHWVIDGASKDGSAEFLALQPEIQFVSEKDQGLSDAVNKGINRAQGEWIIWLNADDELAPGALQAFQLEAAKWPDVSIFCGAQKVFRYDGTLECVSQPWDYDLRLLFGRRIDIIQASTFVRRQVYEDVGTMDVGLKYSMDWEWMIRAMHKYRCQPISPVLTHYHRRKGSIMDANLAEFYRVFLKVRRKYRQPYLDRGELAVRLYLASDPLRKIPQIRRTVRFLKRLLGREPTHPAR